MITYVPVTDPELARELCRAGALLWSDCEGGYEVAELQWASYGPFPIWRDKGVPMFYIQVEE